MKHLVAGLTVALALVAGTAPASAQQKSFALSVDADLVDNGFAGYILPRFSLKAGVRIELTGAAEADALLGRLAGAADGTRLHRVFVPAGGGEAYSLAIRATGRAPHAIRFLEWLQSEVGRRTVERFEADGAAPYAAIEPSAATEATLPVTGDPVRGETLAFRRCGRCHVINSKNRFGGIGSTPSFGAMKTLPHWQKRFQAFWTLNPHPAFTQIEGVTEPFDATLPPPIAPIRLTLDELEDLLAFIHTIEVKDLGAPLQLQ